MKRLWQKHPYKVIIVLTLIALVIFIGMYENEYKPKPGDIVILGESGSMKLAKPEDVGKDDAELGIITITNDSGYTVEYGTVRDINTTDIKH